MPRVDNHATFMCKLSRNPGILRACPGPYSVSFALFFIHIQSLLGNFLVEASWNVMAQAQWARTHHQIRHTPHISGLSRWLLWQISARCEPRFHLHTLGIFSVFVTFSNKTFHPFGSVHWKPLQRKIKLLSRTVKAFHQNSFRWKLLDFYIC